MSAAAEFAVVVPVLNSAAILVDVHGALAGAVRSLARRHRVIFVDDGSRDASWATIVELHRRHGSTVSGLRLGHNVGQQLATWCGLLEAAESNWIATIDDDLQAAPEALGLLLAHAQRTGADLVYGRFVGPLQHALLHRLGTRAFRALMASLSPQAPPASSLRLVAGDVVRRLPRAAARDLLLDPLLSQRARRIDAVDVRHYPSRLGRSRYGSASLAALALRALGERLCGSRPVAQTAPPPERRGWHCDIRARI